MSDGALVVMLSDSSDDDEKDGHWSCRTCTLDNKATTSTCAACGTEKSSEIHQLCTVCTYKNPAKSLDCSMCNNRIKPTGVSRPVRPVEQLAQDKWACSACTFSNPASSAICAVCESPKSGIQAQCLITSISYQNLDLIVPYPQVLDLTMGVDGSSAQRSLGQVRLRDATQALPWTITHNPRSKAK